MGENPPGEQDLLFIFLKALEVYSAGKTTSLISSAEMLKRERKKKKTNKWEKAEKERGGKKGVTRRIASVCFPGFAIC